MERKFRVYDIKWSELSEEDFFVVGDSNEIEYPSTTMDVVVSENDVYDLNDEEEIDDYISDFITDETSFLHEGFMYEELVGVNKN